jgi:hypothetical protein
MGIVTQASLTTLRSLKYGRDQPGGGNSGEPYVTQAIPLATQQQPSSTNIWLSDSGLIRGGFTGATLASGRDFLRIGRFLKDAPRGPLFIAKQVGLQLSNPQLETTGFNLVGPTRIYNLGINTLAQIPVNAFGGHIVRHGLTPFLNEGQTYGRVVVAKDAPGTFGADNRLVALKAKLTENPNANIAQYVSGPGSVDGIGTTTIRRYSNTLNNPQYNQYIDLLIPTTPGIPGGSVARLNITNTAALYQRPVPDIDYFLAQGVSEQYFFDGITDVAIERIARYNNIITGSVNSKPIQIDQNAINYPAGKRTYEELIKVINLQTSSFESGTAWIDKNNPKLAGSINGTNITGPVKFTFSSSATAKYKNLPLDKFNIGTRIRTGGAGERDEVNYIPLFESNVPPGSYQLNVGGNTYYPRDLIKFRIEAVDNDSPNLSTWMVFRALLKNITDNPNPSWNTVNYVGRGEPFYIYKGFERAISFEFQVAAMSEEEMKPMWQKLNYLYSNTMPDYSDAKMRAPYMKLTIGDYLYRQPGIIKSLTYTIDNKSPWEIAIDDPEAAGGSNLYELPQIMTVQMTFAPIHDFLPRKMPRVYNGKNWDELPAFVVDRLDNQNEWLTSIYRPQVLTPSLTINKIPTGKTVTK